MLRDGLPFQQRCNIAAAGVGLVGLRVQLCRHISGCKRFRVHRSSAFLQAVADTLQALDFEVVAVRQCRIAARRKDRADAGVFLDVGERTSVIAVADHGAAAGIAGNARHLCKRIGVFLNTVAADQRTDIIAVLHRGVAAAIANNTRHEFAAGQCPGIVAGANRRTACVRRNSAGTAGVIFIGHIHIGGTVFDTAAVLIGDNAARIGFIAARARRHPHIAVDGQVAHRALVVAEQALIGRALAAEVLNGVAVAIENAGEAVARGLAHRRPKLVAEVDVLGQYSIGIVAADVIDLVGKPRQLFAALDAVPAGHAVISAGRLVRSDLVRLSHRFAVPAFLNIEGNIEGPRLVLNGEVGLGLGCALCLDEVAVLACHEVVNAVFVGGHDLAVRVRNGNLRFAGAVGLGDVEGDRIGRDLRQVDGLHGVLVQIDLTGLRFVAVSADGVGVLALAEVINAVRRALRVAVCVLDHDRRVGRGEFKA